MSVVSQLGADSSPCFYRLVFLCAEETLFRAITFPYTLGHHNDSSHSNHYQQIVIFSFYGVLTKEKKYSICNVYSEQFRI